MIVQLLHHCDKKLYTHFKLFTFLCGVGPAVQHRVSSPYDDTTPALPPPRIKREHCEVRTKDRYVQYWLLYYDTLHSDSNSCTIVVAYYTVTELYTQSSRALFIEVWLTKTTELKFKHNQNNEHKNAVYSANLIINSCYSCVYCFTTICSQCSSAVAQ